MATPSLSWLDEFFGPAVVKLVATYLPKRPVLEFAAGSGITLTAADTPANNSSKLTIATTGSVTVPGSNKQVIYNNSGALGAAAGVEWDNSALTLTLKSGAKTVYIGTKMSIFSLPGEVTTSSTSQTTITGATYTMADETTCTFSAIINYARGTNVTKAGAYTRSVTYRRTSGGAPTIVGAVIPGTDAETTAADDVTFDVSSNDVRVRVTAADTDTRYWGCELRVQEMRIT